MTTNDMAPEETAPRREAANLKTASRKTTSPKTNRPRTPTPVSGDPQQLLSDKFGLPGFRDGQLAVIERLLSGKNVAAVFPTGGGKSLCYQLPSQMFDGTTLVVSPLIALMKDQCDALIAKGIPAARLDSSLEPSQFRSAINSIRDGQIKIVYVSPERFFNERFLATVDSLHVSLFAIDEAHCISQWGHNFRPDYLKLADLATSLNAERILALTATATPSVLEDIRSAFEIQPQDAIRTKFYRPNLKLRSQIIDGSDHYEHLRTRIKDRPAGPTLVYVTLQRTAEELAVQLTEDGIDATAYHAGLDNEIRQSIQQDFLAGEIQIIVATIAFGMGIDKSDIRYVYHFNAPRSLESYAQEIGRAGRDGADSVCELLLNPSDRIVLENFTFGDTPSRHAVRTFIGILMGQADTFHISHYKLSSETDIRILVVRTLITYLELDGYLRSTSPRYDSYKIKPLVTSKHILSKLDGEPREFASGVLSCLTKSRTWFTLNTVLAAKRLDCERARIVKAIQHMSERGWLEVKVSDLVHGYRWIHRPKKSSGDQPVQVASEPDGKKTTLETDPKVIADHLFERLIQRESADVDRMDEVFDLATASSCQAATLSQHFGESLSKPCGDCSACLGDGPFEVPSITARSIGSSVTRMIEELSAEYPDHFITNRQRARFLCGLSSPAVTRARLSRNDSFGICSHVPFRDVLQQVGGIDD